MASQRGIVLTNAETTVCAPSVAAINSMVPRSELGSGM